MRIFSLHWGELKVFLMKDQLGFLTSSLGCLLQDEHTINIIFRYFEDLLQFD